MHDLVLALRELIREIVTEDIALIISVAVIIATFFLVWLLLRGIRLWYWKVNDRAGTLNRIETRLKNVEKHMAQESRIKPAHHVGRPEEAQSAPAHETESERAPLPEPLQTEPMTAGMDGAAVPPAINAVRENESDGQEVPVTAVPIDMEQCQGRSGRIYLRQELETQIRD